MEFRQSCNSNLECFTERSVELWKRSDDDAEYFSGYLVVFYDGTPGTQYKRKDGRIERIDEKAFDNVFNSPVNKELVWQHDKATIIADTDSKTLTLTKDNVGWKFLAPVDKDDPDSMKVRAKIKKKWCRGCSFNADGEEYRYRDKNGDFIAHITRVDKIFDLSLVRSPAYKNAVGNLVRSEEDEYDAMLAKINRAKQLNKWSEDKSLLMEQKKI